MKLLNDIMNNTIIVKIFWSIIIIIISSICYKIISRTIINKLEKDKIKALSNKKTRTYIKMFNSITRYIFIIITILIILQIFGINISSMIAGVGIISIIIGFAIQDALKDIIKGFDIISDSYYQVGDVIKFNNITGKVLTIGLKTTKVQDIYSLNIVSISNRNIELIEVVSNLINIDIPLPYELKIRDARKVINDIVNNIKELDKVDNCEYRGVNELGDSSINYQIKVYCHPTIKVQIRRDALSTIIEVLEENNIQVPYNQLDIHNK